MSQSHWVLDNAANYTQAFVISCSAESLNQQQWLKERGMVSLQIQRKRLALHFKQGWLDEIVKTDTSEGTGMMVKLSDIFA